MTLMTDYRALAGQSPVRVIAKAAISLIVVGIAAFFSREALALAIIIIFTGVTGPAIRLVTMKMDGTYDRIIVSPAAKPRFFLAFAGLWTIAVLLPLVPAIMVVMVRDGPVTIIPVIPGTVLAAVLGTLAGFVARGLSDAHLAAVVLSGLFIVLTVIRTPVAVFLPSAILSSPSGETAALITPAILPVIALAVLALAVSRS
jgi:hypothetical protein